MHRPQSDHVSTLYHTESDHVHFDLLTRETYAKHRRLGAKAISLSTRSLNPLNLKIKIKILICHPYSFRKHCCCKEKIDADHS